MRTMRMRVNREVQSLFNRTMFWNLVKMSTSVTARFASRSDPSLSVPFYRTCAMSVFWFQSSLQY